MSTMQILVLVLCTLFFGLEQILGSGTEAAFDRLDLNGDNRITVNELIIQASITNSDLDRMVEVAKAIMDGYDLDSDRIITFGEFYRGHPTHSHLLYTHFGKDFE